MEEMNIQNLPRKAVTGTDADLRRLSLAEAKQILRKCNYPEEAIRQLTRWEIIDAVRTVSTEQARAGREAMSKFARGSRFSIAEYQERYKEECQRIFDLQNRVLSSKEVLSSDDNSSSEDASDIEELGKNIENMFANEKTNSQLFHEQEEIERQKLYKAFLSDNGDKKKEKEKQKEEREDDSALSESGGSNSSGKILKIYRTFQNEEGKEFVRVETVRKPAVIEMYTRIRETKGPDFVKQQVSAILNEHQKEEIRKEKKRIQEQLRRLKRNEEKDKLLPRKKLKKYQTLLKMKCGACGSVGHMRTNKSCPLYQASVPLPPVQVAMTEEQEEEEERILLNDDNLIKVDETKVVLSKRLFEHADELRRKSLILKIPKEAVSLKKRRTETVVQYDYLKRPHKYTNRRNTDPAVTLSIILEGILNEMKNLPETQAFWFPVNARRVPDYYNIVQHPMDLQTIRDKLYKKCYQSRDQFLQDVNQIVDNSVLYNGVKSPLTITSQKMLQLCTTRFANREEQLSRLEKTINPLTDGDQVAFSYILETIVESDLKTIPDSWPFHEPVSKKFVKDYYSVIKNPMDLDTIIKNVKKHKYHSCAEFQADVDLLETNSRMFNGTDSHLTKKAREIIDACWSAKEKYRKQLSELENAIKATQEAVLGSVQMCVDSVITHTSKPNHEKHFGRSGKKRKRPEYHMIAGDGDMDFVNIEGDEEEEEKRKFEDYGESYFQQDAGSVDKSALLAKDLQIMSENSENEGVSSESDNDMNEELVEMDTQGQNGDFQQLAQQHSANDENSEIIDENYDPSEFLIQGNYEFQQSMNGKNCLENIINDLAVSDSEEEEFEEVKSPLNITNDDDDEFQDLWF